MALVPLCRPKTGFALHLAGTSDAGQRMYGHVRFSSAQILWERISVIYLSQYLQGILSIVIAVKFGRQAEGSEPRQRTEICRDHAMLRACGCSKQNLLKGHIFGLPLQLPKETAIIFQSFKRQTKMYSATIFLHVPGL